MEQKSHEFAKKVKEKMSAGTSFNEAMSATLKEEKKKHNNMENNEVFWAAVQARKLVENEMKQAEEISDK